MNVHDCPVCKWRTYGLGDWCGNNRCPLYHDAPNAWAIPTSISEQARKEEDMIGVPPPKLPTEDWKPTNPKDRAATTRLDISLFPDTAVAYGALAMTEGDCKYGGYNFRSAGVLASIYYAACRRHLSKWFNGEDNDPKTGLPHLANALACIAVLIDAIEANKLKDDRPPRTDLAGLLSRMESDVKRLQELFPDGPGRYTEANKNDRH